MRFNYQGIINLPQSKHKDIIIFNSYFRLTKNRAPYFALRKSIWYLRTFCLIYTISSLYNKQTKFNTDSIPFLTFYVTKNIFQYKKNVMQGLNLL
jgi:hypothetical protein